MTRRERLEAKLEKRREWAESRRVKSEKEFRASDMSEAATGIPFGQPILVGHHSERRHRRLIERKENAMRRCVEHSDMAKHHESKAVGLEIQLERTIFSDDENAIEALEAKITKLESDREKNNAVNKIIRSKPKNELTEDKVNRLCSELNIKESTARKLFEPDFCGRIGIPSYVNQNIGGRIKQAKDRIADIERRLKRQAAAESSSNGVLIEGKDYVFVTFAEKPEREILTALKASGFRWGGGHWNGYRDKLPECVTQMIEA